MSAAQAHMKEEAPTLAKTALEERNQVTIGTLRAASPAALIAEASGMADELAGMIKAQKLAVRIQGREYVQVEGWTTLAAMLGATAREVSTEESAGIYIATVELVRMVDGAVLSRASAECGEERPWCMRPRYARRSMAQTRATGKACRLAFSWIMRLAGYEATPAEEMQFEQEPETTQKSRPDTSMENRREEAPQTRGGGSPIKLNGRDMSKLPTISEAQKRRLEARIGELQIDRERVKEWIKRAWRIEHFQDLPKELYTKLDEKLELWAQAQREERARMEKEKEQALEDARLRKWNGDIAELPDVIEAMLRDGASIKKAAPYKDRGAGEEIRRGNEIERRAHILERILAEHEATEERAAIQAE